MLKSAWAPLYPSIKNIINEASFGTFFEVLLNHETHEYKDFQLLLALAERFQDNTCTFHFSGIGEVMLTPYDFSVITDLRLGGNNIPLFWLYKSIPQCETVAKGARMSCFSLLGPFCIWI